MTRLTAMIAAALLAGCATVMPHTFPPNYQTNSGQQCVKACWQPGVGCPGHPFDRCWYNDRCKAQCDAAERDALVAQRTQR